MGASRSSPRIRDSNRGPCSYARHASECSSHRPLSSAIAKKTRRPSVSKVSRSTSKVVRALNPFFSGARRKTLRNQDDTCARPDCPEPQVTPEAELFFVEKLVGRKKSEGYVYMWLAKWEG